jgi:hypothetical protein
MDIALPAVDTRTLAEQGVKVPVLDLTGNPLLNAKGEPVSLFLLGSDSKQYRSASRALARNRLKRAQTNKSKGAVSDDQLDAADADEVELIVQCTVGWEGIIDSKAKPVDYTPEGARWLYTTYPVIREQADKAIVDRARFTTPS